MCQAYAESHGIIFNCNKTVCMTYRAKSAKSTITPLLTLGSQNVKSVTQYKYLGIILDAELSDDKGIQRQMRYQYCAANKLRDSFSRCSNAVKNVLFRSFCTPMYAIKAICLATWANYGNCQHVNDKSTVTYFRPLHQRGQTTVPQATCGAQAEFLWPASFFTIDCCVDIRVGIFN